MATFDNLEEAMASIQFGMCDICKAEHEFPNIKCDLMVIEDKNTHYDENDIYYSGGIN